MSLIATFHTHFGALSFQNALKKGGVQSKMMPVPRSLSSSCGTCVSFEGAFSQDMANEDMEAVYMPDGTGYSMIFEMQEE